MISILNGLLCILTFICGVVVFNKALSPKANQRVWSSLNSCGLIVGMAGTLDNWSAWYYIIWMVAIASSLWQLYEDGQYMRKNNL